ncbi:hypothetical protein IV37_GL000839 [Fructilactobacillus fructivorans]|nr:hypothetical protein IV37_GL000839 [Fructilactobacillus fructivorans]
MLMTLKAELTIGDFIMAVNLLTGLSGICWSLVYIMMIYIGFKHKTYCMPLWAAGLNIAWELLYSISNINTLGFALPTAIHVFWFLLDIGVIACYFIYGKKYQIKDLQPYYILQGITVILASFIIEYAFYDALGATNGSNYSAFSQNLLMSVLFIVMFFKRPNLEGQSLTIAIAKFIGTLAPTILDGFILSYRFVTWIGLLCAVYDIAYIILVALAKIDLHHAKTALNN